MAVAPVPDTVQASSENTSFSSSPPENQCTAPPGVIAAPGEVSVTVAVHVEDAPSRTGVSHCAAVAVSRASARICAEPALASCSESPVNVAVTAWVAATAAV